SGGFRTKLSTSHTFGFTSLSQGIVTLKPLGVRVIDPDQEKPARVEAFLNVPLYNAVYEQFKNGPLPPPQGLEAAMVSLGVVNKQAVRARQAFQKSAKEAGFFAYGASKLVYPALGNQAGAEKPKESEKQPDPKPKNGSGDDDGGGNGLPPYVQLLVSKLPEPETKWAMSGRKKWLEAALKIFDLVYEEEPADSEEELTITLGTPGTNSAK
ncbi:MAG TPA: hypothetical protein VFN62_09890, partial [Acidobacteriaceae bacterium]|nr:hypothetical protein [Acidobacteriaceae bacterium]